MSEPAMSEPAMSEATASSAAKAPEWDDVVDRIVTRQRRRSRTAIVTLAALAVIGPAVAVGVTRQRKTVVAAAPTTATTAATTTTEIATTTTSTSLVPVSTVPKVTGGIENQIFGQQLLETVFVDTYDRYTVRLFKMKQNAQNNPWFGGGFTDPEGKPWSPPIDCMPTNYVAQVSDASLATRIDFALGGDARMSQMFGGQSSIVSTPIGVEEQAPAWIAIIPVPENQKAVKVAFPNGVVVDALVRSGFAIAVRPDPGLDWQTANSAQRMRVDLGEGLVRMKAPKPTARAECRLPANMGFPVVEMPRPGEGPANSVQAAIDVEEAVLAFFDQGASTSDRVALVDKPGDLAQILDKLKESVFNGLQFGPGLRGQQQEPIVLETVFTSPTKVSLEVFFGQSVRTDLELVDGRWKLSRDTACTMLQWFGPGCMINDPQFEQNGGFGFGGVATTAAPAFAG
jgi:hypothetical protein